MRSHQSPTTPPRIASACSKSSWASATRCVHSSRSRCRARPSIVCSPPRSARRPGATASPGRSSSPAAKERFRKTIYAAAASGTEDGHDFPPPREYLGVYLERRRESGFQLYNTLGIIRGDKAAYAKQALENYNFFGAPHVAVIHTDEPLGVYGAIDCGAYVANFMLAAQALGLGTIPQAALARHSKLIRRHFNLPDDRRVVCGISFGFADHAHLVNSYRTSRAKVADTVTFVDE